MINKAIEAYNKALALKPNYAEALNNKGNACHELGKLEDAIEAYNKALSLNPIMLRPLTTWVLPSKIKTDLRKR
jgi:tetratricopeptide (TPR) repeat protein